MANDLQELEHELEALLHRKAERLEFIAPASDRLLRRARRRIVRNAVGAIVAMALAVYAIVGVAGSVNQGTGIQPTPARPGPSPTDDAPVVPVPQGNSPIGDITETIPVGAGPVAVAIGGGFVWVEEESDVSRIDPVTNEVALVELDGLLLRRFAFGFDSLWVSNGGTEVGSSPAPPRSSDPPEPKVGPSPPALPQQWIERVDPGTRSVTHIAMPDPADPIDIAVGEDSVWVSNSGYGTVSRIDPLTNRVAATIPIDEGSGGYLQHIAALDGMVWVYAVDAVGSTNLVAIDQATGKVDGERTIHDLGLQAPGNDPTELLVGDGSLWLTGCFPGVPACTWEVLRIDPDRGIVIARIRVGELRNGIVDAGEGMTRAAAAAVERGTVWVLANVGSFGDPSAHGWLIEIDAATNTVGSSKDIGEAYLYDIAFGDGSAWAVDAYQARVLRLDYGG